MKDSRVFEIIIQGLGTKESVLIEIICSRTSAELHDIKLEYQSMFEKDLVHELEKELSGELKHLLVALCTTVRDESDRIKIRLGNQDAEGIYKVCNQV